MPTEKKELAICRVDKELPLPKYETDGSLGFDLACRQDTEIKPGEITLIPANVIIKIPADFVLFITLRSSTPRKKGLIMPHGVGVIDSDYCGPKDEIKIQVQNTSSEIAKVKKGERIAQGILLRCDKFRFKEVEKMKNKSRGGFGSTG